MVSDIQCLIDDLVFAVVILNKMKSALEARHPELSHFNHERLICVYCKFEWGQVGPLPIPDDSSLWSMSVTISCEIFFCAYMKSLYIIILIIYDFI